MHMADVFYTDSTAILCPSRTLLRTEHIREFEINFSNILPDGLASVFLFVAMVTLA